MGALRLGVICFPDEALLGAAGPSRARGMACGVCLLHCGGETMNRGISAASFVDRSRDACYPVSVLFFATVRLVWW